MKPVVCGVGCAIDAWFKKAWMAARLAGWIIGFVTLVSTVVVLAVPGKTMLTVTVILEQKLIIKKTPKCIT